MNNKALQTALVVIAVLAVARVVTADPGCGRGCKTLVGHLVDHIAGDAVARLLA